MRARPLAAAVLLATACGRLDFAQVAHGDGGGDGDTAAIGDADPDATGDGAAAACAPGHLLCDTFDSIFIDGAVWTAAGSVSQDTVITHSGARSMKMHIPATTAGQQVASYFYHTGSVISNATHLWTRAWMRIDLLPPSTNALELIALEQTGMQGDYVFVRAADTQLFHQFDNQSGGAGTAPPLNTWFCLVWDITFATTATGSAFVTSDVLPPFSITSSITQGNPKIDTLTFGPFYAATNLDVATAAFDVWIDDVIVDDVPVTCSD